MKHLHGRFILASMGCGFGLLFVFAAGWNVHLLTLIGWTSIRMMLTSMLFAGAGIVLLVFGWQDIRLELYGQKK